VGVVQIVQQQLLEGFDRSIRETHPGALNIHGFAFLSRDSQGGGSTDPKERK